MTNTQQVLQHYGVPKEVSEKFEKIALVEFLAEGLCKKSATLKIYSGTLAVASWVDHAWQVEAYLMEFMGMDMLQPDTDIQIKVLSEW